MKTQAQTVRGSGGWQGMNWIRQDKRLAIYLRDGLACAWCGTAADEGVTLTLDHIKPASRGGSNDESNLVTCCKTCNEKRGVRGPKRFAKMIAGQRAEKVLAHVRSCAARSLKAHRAEALRLIERRGSAAKVIATM